MLYFQPQYIGEITLLIIKITISSIVIGLKKTPIFK